MSATFFEAIKRLCTFWANNNIDILDELNCYILGDPKHLYYVCIVIDAFMYILAEPNTCILKNFKHSYI
jgi:hypothetical protein